MATVFEFGFNSNFNLWSSLRRKEIKTRLNLSLMEYSIAFYLPTHSIMQFIWFVCLFWFSQSFLAFLCFYFGFPWWSPSLSVFTSLWCFDSFFTVFFIFLPFFYFFCLCFYFSVFWYFFLERHNEELTTHASIFELLSRLKIWLCLLFEFDCSDRENELSHTEFSHTHFQIHTFQRFL